MIGVEEDPGRIGEPRLLELVEHLADPTVESDQVVVLPGNVSADRRGVGKKTGDDDLSRVGYAGTASLLGHAVPTRGLRCG